MRFHPPEAKALTLAWPSRFLYAGPSFPELSFHRNAVGIFCVGLDGPLRITLGEPEEDKRWYRTRAFLLAPNRRHLEDFEGRTIACLYLDPESDDPVRLAIGMRSVAAGLFVDHPREEEIAQAVAELRKSELKRSELRRRLADLFNLPNRDGSDPRLASTILKLRANPAAAHRLEDLARDAGLSASRFRHAFKEGTGVSLKRFRLWNRLGTAIALAAKGESLTQAALAAGFSSSAHFSSAFRSMFGNSPSDFLQRAARASGASNAP